MFKNQKIRQRMILYYSLVILLCVYAISSFSYYQASKTIIRSTTENIQRILEQSSKNIDKTLEDIETVINTFIANQAVYNILEHGKTSFVVQDRQLINIYDILTDITLIRPEIQSVHIFDYRGKIYGNKGYNEKWTFEELKNKAERGKGKLVWFEATENNSAITYVRLIKNNELKDIGVLLVKIRKNSLEKLFKWQEESFRSSSMIVDENDNVIISSGVDLLNGDSIINSSQYKRYYYESTYNNWKYINIISKDDLLKDARIIREGVFFWGIFFTCIFWVLSYLISYEITMPIKKITDAIKDFEVKENVEEIHFKKRDEIAYLYDSFVEMTYRINTLVEKNYEQGILHNKQQIKILQAQINPHFLYNTLDIINWKAREKNVPEIGGMIKALSNNLRYSFAGEDLIVSLADEVEHIKDYLYLQYYRFQDELNYEISIDKSILKCSILQLTLQPIVENCIIHAFKEVETDMQIKIKAYVRNKNLYIEIMDNGKGMSKEKLDRLLMQSNHRETVEESIGLNNVNKRLTLKYGNEYGLSFESQLNVGTKVTIVLPETYLED